MKHVFTLIILGHWLIFFVLHSLGALAGSLTFASISGLSHVVAAFGAGGAIKAMPLVSAGMGTASLLVATLFLWAILSNMFETQTEQNDGDVDTIAFGGAALLFTMLSALSIVDADPVMLLASTGYFAALVLSWLATKYEAQQISSTQETFQTLTDTTSIARSMAGSAAHNNVLARIAGRERN